MANWFTDLLPDSLKPIDTIKVDAQRLVLAPNDEEAVVILAQYTGEDQQHLIDEAVKLGADRAALDEMMKIFGRGETINITQPIQFIFPRWPLIVMALGGLVVGAIVQSKTRR